MSKKSDVAVLGGGNCAHSLSCHLSKNGYAVHLWARNLEHLDKAERKSLTIKAYGKMEGNFKLASENDNLEETVKNCPIIFIAAVTTAYDDIATKAAPYLHEDQIIVVFSSKLAGSALFEQSVLKVRPELQGKITVCETDALFASRLQPDGRIWVRGIKKWNLVSAPRRKELDKALPVMQEIFAGLHPADNIIQRGLSDFGALAHPLTMIANMNRIDRSEPFLFYADGFTKNTIVLMENLEKEFQAVALAYGTSLLPAEKWLDNYYGCDTSSLLNAMRTVPNYQTSQAPVQLNHRYLKEDVSCTLVPLHYLAKLADIPTPITDAIITFASILAHEDFLATGRTLDKLGWANLTAKQIRERIS